MKLVKTIKWDDGRIETKEYNLKDWKGIRYYIVGQKDAYIDRKKNLVVLSRSRSYELEKEYECRGPRKNYILTYTIAE